MVSVNLDRVENFLPESLPERQNWFEKLNSNTLVNVELPELRESSAGIWTASAGGDDNLDQQFAYAEQYHAHYDAIDGRENDDRWPQQTNDGNLRITELPIEIEREAHSLLSIFSHGKMGDHIMDGDAGFTLDDLKFFAAEGIVSFTEVSNPAAGEAGIEMSIDIDAVPYDRMETAFAELSKGNVVNIIDEGLVIEDAFSTVSFGDTMKDIFGFDESDVQQLDLLEDVFDEAVIVRRENPEIPKDEIDIGVYTAGDLVAAMTRLDIEPGDFIPRSLQDSYDELIGSLPETPEPDEVDEEAPASAQATAFIEKYDESDNAPIPNPGVLGPNEFPDEVYEPLLLLRNVHLLGGPDDHVLYAGGIDAHDIDYFVSQGMIEFNGDDITVDVDKIPRERFARGLQPDGSDMDADELATDFERVFLWNNDGADESALLFDILVEATGLDEDDTEGLKEARFSAEDALDAMDTLGIDKFAFF